MPDFVGTVFPGGMLFVGGVFCYAQVLDHAYPFSRVSARNHAQLEVLSKVSNFYEPVVKTLAGVLGIVLEVALSISRGKTLKETVVDKEHQDNALMFFTFFCAGAMEMLFLVGRAPPTLLQVSSVAYAIVGLLLYEENRTVDFHWKLENKAHLILAYSLALVSVCEMVRRPLLR